MATRQISGEFGNYDDAPNLMKQNTHALSAYLKLHTARTKDYPGAWQASFQIVPILVKDQLQAEYFIQVWDQIYLVERIVQETRIEQQRKARERLNTNEKQLRTG